jgi:hypothetical protein
MNETSLDGTDDSPYALYISCTGDECKFKANLDFNESRCGSLVHAPLVSISGSSDDYVSFDTTKQEFTFNMSKRPEDVPSQREVTLDLTVRYNNYLSIELTAATFRIL